MNTKMFLVSLLAISVSLFSLGCVGTDSLSSTGQSDAVKGTWIKSSVDADTVSIPVSSLDKYTNVHFKVNTDIGEVAVMAYKLGDSIFVRSNVCPPCGSIGFTLRDGILVCDTCATEFDAATGEGIRGGCVAYPKESIPYTISGGNIAMKLEDVVAAHKKTVEAY